MPISGWIIAHQQLLSVPAAPCPSLVAAFLRRRRTFVQVRLSELDAKSVAAAVLAIAKLSELGASEQGDGKRDNGEDGVIGEGELDMDSLTEVLEQKMPQFDPQVRLDLYLAAVHSLFMLYFTLFNVASSSAVVHIRLNDCCTV